MNILLSQRQIRLGFKSQSRELRKVCFCGKLIENNEITDRSGTNYCSEKHREYARLMNNQLNVYLYLQRPEIKEGIRKRQKEYMREYNRKPRVKKRMQEYYL
ncbi:hypothetical protein LCGC14_2967380, partial [marine sediment metagenome]